MHKDVRNILVKNTHLNNMEKRERERKEIKSNLMYTVHTYFTQCIMYTAYCARCRLYTAYCILHSAYCAYCILDTLHTVHAV